MACSEGEPLDLRHAISGDIGDYRDVILNGVTDLSTVSSAEAHVTKGGTVDTLVVTVEDATARIVRIHLGDAGEWLPSGPDLGWWLGQIEVVFNDGSELTWPSTDEGQRFFRIRIEPELG